MILSNTELRKAQLLMLKILKEVHRICQENDIKYFLSDGTLIGAVRHNGFIPWDDDLDIGMLRADYEKFCKIAPDKLGNEFVLQTNTSDSGYALQFGKLMLKDTIWLEEARMNTNRQYVGLFIDIFPYDEIPQNKKKQKRIFRKYKLYNSMLNIKLNYYSIRDSKGVLRKSYFIIRKVIVKFLTSEKIASLRDNVCKNSASCETQKLVTKYGGNFYKNQNSIQAYSDLELHQFEDSQFYIPKNYDNILATLYGSYKELPPEEKRINHGIYKYDFGNY